MFQTEGPLHPSSPLFVGRTAEIRRLTDWVERADCVGAVSGARQTGKTSLLLQLQQCVQDKYGFVFIDLEVIHKATVNECYAFICSEMLLQLSQYLSHELKPTYASDGASFLKFLRELSQGMSVIRAAIVLDEIGALPHEASLLLAHTLRSVLSSRHIHTEYARFVFILSGSSDMKRFTTDKVSPLRNVIDCVYVPDLSHDEADQVLSRGFELENLDVSPDLRQYIFDWANGHPYLTQLMGKSLVEHCRVTGIAPNEQMVQQIAEEILEREDKNLPHMRRLLDTVSPQLWSYTARIMAGKPPMRFSRSNEHLADLELIGVIRVTDSYCSIRNRIYERALQLWMDERKQRPDDPQSLSRKQVWHLGRPIRGLLSAQKLALLVIVLSLATDALLNWTQPPLWLAQHPWLWGILLAFAVLVFIVSSIIQARGPKPHPSDAQYPGEDGDSADD